jgi:phage terminase large subunit-like protein
MSQPHNLSVENLLALEPEAVQEAILSQLSEAQCASLLYDWDGYKARPSQQIPPGDWRYWLIQAGRGFGKTRTGAETVREWVSRGYRIIHLVGATAADTRDVMVQGEAGLMSCFPPHQRPFYEPSKRLVTFHTGAQAHLFSADEPERLRGPSCSAFWVDEICLAKGTLIETVSGPRKIENIRAGDIVHTRVGLRAVVKAWRTSRSAPLWELTTSDGRSLKGTESHPVFCDGAFVPLRKTKPGSILETWQANQHRSCGAVPCVVSVGPTGERGEVFNLEVEGQHEYYANGILTHNCSWRFGQDSWDNLNFGFRLGNDPRGVITTTPKPIKLLKDIIKDPHTHVTRASSYENRANLAPAFFDSIIRKYEGTRLGRQELEAELLEDIPGALWTRAMIDAYRLKLVDIRWDLIIRIVVAIDPAVTSGEDSDETGIIVCGLTVSLHVIVIEDLTCRETPLGWARIAVAAYKNRRADRIVGEVNNGGDLVEANIRAVAPEVSFRAVRASRGKAVRAEPIAALYEQGRCHHIGAMPELEDQLVSWTPQGNADSPDRMDALVWAITELLVDQESERYVLDLTDEQEISRY